MLGFRLHLVGVRRTIVVDPLVLKVACCSFVMVIPLVCTFDSDLDRDLKAYKKLLEEH